MLFVTVNMDKKQQSELAQLLLETFHGSVIYQHAEPAKALGDIWAHKIDAAFVGETLNSMDGIAAMLLLRGRCPNLRVFILSEHGDYCRFALRMGASGALHYPITGQDIEKALRTEE